PPATTGRSPRGASISAPPPRPISLSWHHALLLPRCVRRNSSPASSMGTPWDKSSVATRLRTCRRRSASTRGLSVGPSTPQFQLQLSLAPSRLPSPLARLCFWLSDPRSASVKPSWHVTKLIECSGDRPDAPYRSLDPDRRLASLGTWPRSPFQKRRTSSRYWPFHSDQRLPNGKLPTW